MKAIKICLSLSVLFAVSLISSLALSSTDVSAASPQDNAIRETNTLSIISQNGQYNTSIKDGEPKTWYHYAMESTCGGSFEGAFLQGRYAVSQVIDEVQGDNNAVPYWNRMGTWVQITYDPTGGSSPSTFDGDEIFSTLIPSQDLHSIWVYYNSYGDISTTCFLNPKFNYLSTSGNVYGDYALKTEAYLYRFYDLPLTYPSGYEGPLAQQVNPVGNPVKFGYSVTDKKLIMNNLTTGLRGDEECRWYVNNNPAQEAQPGDINGDIIINRDCYASPEYNFKEYGYYEVSLSVHYPHGLNGLSPRTSWQAYKTLHIDGSTFSGTGDINGDYNPLDPLANSNANNWFTSLNIPTYGLQDMVLAPLQFVADIQETTCAPLVLPLPNSIGNITMPCMTPIYQQNFGTILALYQTILTGLFAYYVSLKIFGNVKEIVNPRDDQIDTVRL